MAEEFKKIVIRKGDRTSFNTLQAGNGLLQGEFGLVTGENKLYIGIENGASQEVATGNVVKTINGEAPNAATGAITISPKDVIGGTPSNGQILEYDSTSQEWVPGVNHEVTGFGFTYGQAGTTLNIIKDSDSQNPLNLVINDVLPIEELKNVTITDLQPNEILKYNGTAWVNTSDANTQTIVDGLTIDSNHLVTLSQTNSVADINLDLSGIGNKTVKSFGYNEITNSVCLDSNGDVTAESDQASCEAISGNTWTTITTTNYDQIDLILEDDTVISLDITQSQAGLSGTVTNFVLSENTKIQLSVEGRETPYEVDISGIRDSLINSVSFNSSNDGVLTLGTIGGSEFNVDLDGRFATTGALSSHTHGLITNDGKISGNSGLNVDIPVENGDKLVIANTSAGDLITTSDITFDASTTNQYLNKAGQFSQPAIADISGLQDDLDGKASSTHTHGEITNDGKIGTNNSGFALSTGDHLVFADNSDANRMKTTSITFDTTQPTKYLSQDGTFSVPTVQTPGTYTQTTLTTLVGNGTYAISNFTGYDKIDVILYAEQTGAHNGEEPDGDSIQLDLSVQLGYDTYQDASSGTCFVGGEPTLAQNQIECDAAGGTWVPTEFISAGKVSFQPGGRIERLNSTSVRFIEPTAVPGHTWKLKIVGVQF